MRIYMDHNATSPLSEAAGSAIRGATDEHLGNPSSVHAAGRQARDRVEAARREVAALLGGGISEIVFTSGGTEADWLGVHSLATAASGPVWTHGTAHPALVGAADVHSQQPARLVVDGAGRIDLSSVERACVGGAGVIAIELANHEVGTVQDVAAIATLAHARGMLVHCDAVQAAGKLPLDVVVLGVDSLAISAHKIGGPMGVGALWTRPGMQVAGPANGGHQERGRRAGTENVLGIIGFGAAAADARDRRLGRAAEVAALAVRLATGLSEIEGACIHGGDATRVGNTISVRFAGALGEVVVQALDIAGVAVSTGAACTSGSGAPSPTLLALGLSKDAAREAVRFSLGPGNHESEVEAVLELLPGIIARARAFR